MRFLRLILLASVIIIIAVASILVDGPDGPSPSVGRLRPSLHQPRRRRVRGHAGDAGRRGGRHPGRRRAVSRLSASAVGLTAPALRVGFFALRHGQDLNTRITAYARDAAGNEATTPVEHWPFVKKFVQSTIPLDQRFLDRVVPAIASKWSRPEDRHQFAGRPAQGVPRDQREPAKEEWRLHRLAGRQQRAPQVAAGVPVNSIEWWDPHWLQDHVLRIIAEAGSLANGQSP